MKKSAAVKLAACLLAASVAGAPLPLWADSPPAPAVEKLVDKKPAKPSNSSISLEKAIAIAKEKVPVQEELNLFSSDYREHSGKGRWVLRWHSGKAPESNMYVTVNASSGEIENISLYKGLEPGPRYQGLPAYSRDQCLEIARREGARLLPDKFADTIPAPREQWHQPPVLRERDYPVIYDFNFKRTYSGIRIADQGIDIGVNAETGEVIRFDCNWDTEAGLPAPEGRISSDQAKKIFTEKAGFELTYFVPHRGDPDSPGDLKLVYRPKPPGRFFLNALTGEVVDTRNMDFYFDDFAGGRGGDLMSSREKKAEIALTPAEKKVVKETGELISADKAQEIASSLAGVPREYTVASRSLEQNYGVPGGRVWNIQFAGPDKKNWIWVSVDARTGDLTSFNRDNRMNPEDYYKEPEVKIGEEEARKKAGDLIKKLQPSRWGQVALRDSDTEAGPWIKMGKVAPRAYSFNYARVVNGVVYPENGFRVRVNSSTGEVSSYHMIWWETSFPGAGGVISAAAVNEKYLAEHPLTLEYSRGHKRWPAISEQPEYYLIYRPSGGYGVMLDAATGQEIDYQGNPVVKKGKQPFSDISGHPAEEDIMLLAGEGIIAGAGGKFRPDDPATAAEMLAMLVKAYGNRGHYYPLAGAGGNDPWYKPVVESALAKGILDKDFTLDPGAGLTRLQLARLGINAGGWGKLAKVSRIFTLDVSDAGLIPADYRGYAAAAIGLELLAPRDGKFSPGGGVTRAEAASFLVRLMKK